MPGPTKSRDLTLHSRGNHIGRRRHVPRSNIQILEHVR
jgi:hypothetical protein